MKTIYRLNTEDYKPISYKDSYVYEQHKRIVSFLKSRLDSSKIRKILKPKLVRNTVEWQGDFDVEMRPIDHASSEEKVKIEKEYLALIEEVERLTKRMKNSGDSDQIEWANFLADVFRVENNMIVYEGQDWAFIWGWKFKSKLTILNPDFVGIPDSEPEPEPEPEHEHEHEPEPPSPPPPPLPPVKARRLTFFEYIKRFLRWFAYRFWALMLLILLILLIICLCRRCCAPEFNCTGINKELGSLQGRSECCCNDEILVPDSPDNPLVEIIPTNETIFCIAVIDETVQQTQHNINTSWNEFRKKYPDREFHLLRPLNTERIDTFYFPEIEPIDFKYTIVNRDEGDASKVSDWFEIVQLDRLPENSRISLFIDVSGSMNMSTVSASYDVFIRKITEKNFIIEKVEIGNEDYIRPFITDFSF